MNTQLIQEVANKAGVTLTPEVIEFAKLLIIDVAYQDSEMNNPDHGMPGMSHNYGILEHYGINLGD